MAFLNGVGVRGVVSRSDLWFGVMNLQEGKQRLNSDTGSHVIWIQRCVKEGRAVQRVFLLRERGFVPVQRGRDHRLLAAHRRGGQRRILQVQRVLLGPHVEELWQHWDNITITGYFTVKKYEMNAESLNKQNIWIKRVFCRLSKSNLRPAQVQLLSWGLW